MTIDLHLKAVEPLVYGGKAFDPFFTLQGGDALSTVTLYLTGDLVALDTLLNQLVDARKELTARWGQREAYLVRAAKDNAEDKDAGGAQ